MEQNRSWFRQEKEKKEDLFGGQCAASLAVIAGASIYFTQMNVVEKPLVTLVETEQPIEQSQNKKDTIQVNVNPENVEVLNTSGTINISSSN